MSDVDNGAAPAAPATEAIAPAQTAVEAPVNTMDAIAKTMSETYDKINPPRSDGGQFAPKDKAEADVPAKTEITDQTQTPPVEQVKPAIDAPVSWSAEMKAKWSSLPPDVAAYAAQREGEAHKRISELGSQVKAYEPLRTVIEQYGATFQRNGLQPHEGIARMMAVHDMLEKDAPSAIKRIAEAYGVDLSGAQPAEGEQSDYIRSLEARLSRAEKLAGEAHNSTRAQVEAENRRQQAELASTIEKFSKDKPHFEAVRHVMAGLMQSGAAETLDDAYDMAIHANKDIRESISAERRKEAEAKAAEEAKKKAEQAKKAASLNVKGTSASPAKKGNWMDTMREVGERIAS